MPDCIMFVLRDSAIVKHTFYSLCTVFDHVKIARRVFEIEQRALLDACAKLGASFDSAVELILQCKGHVLVCGVGKSGHIARKIAATLASTGTPSFFIHPAEALHGDLGMITPANVLISLSKSGETEEILRIIPYLKKYHIKHVAFTGNPASTVARHADVVLDTSVAEEACPLQLAPTSSTTVSLVMGDALAVALMEARGFQPEDFAVFHPGGSLGKKLLTKVKDEMHTHHIPVAHLQTPIREIVARITDGGMGLVVITDAENCVQGVITDGDIRRAIASKQDATFFELIAADIMNPSPKTIQPESSLTDAEKLMNEHSINALLVVQHQKLRGVLLRLVPRQRRYTKI